MGEQSRRLGAATGPGARPWHRTGPATHGAPVRGADGSRLARLARASLALAAATPLAVSGTVVLAVLLAPGLPSLRPAFGPPAGQVSQVYDAAGAEIARFHEHDRYLPVDPEDIPDHLARALVAAEDSSFYRHDGIDLRGALRALLADIRAGSIEQGGSTITQQYVKNAFTGRERTWARKLREAVLARRLEQGLGKDEILARYLSTVYLGNGAHGVGAAASTYFRKPVRDLTVSEAALLVGMIPAPSRYDPRTDPEAAERKRVIVLDKMREQGYLDAGEHERALRARVWASAAPPPAEATVVWPPASASGRYPYFVDYVRRYVEATVDPEALRRGGLQIHTTLDPAAQAAAEGAVGHALAGVAPPLDMALVAVEPRTGFVRALVGGRDFGAPGGQVNLALGRCPDRRHDGVDVAAGCWGDDEAVVEGGGTGRQPGSSWKPFVLAAALEEGIRPTAVYRAPASYRVPGCAGEKGCVIRNIGGRGFGRATLEKATVRSINTVYAQLIADVGVARVGETARRMGITTAWVSEPERHGLSYALGVQEVSPLEMASAYGVLAAGGLRTRPTPVLHIRGPDGHTLEDNRSRSPERVLSATVSRAVTEVLEGVITRGTGRRAAIGRPAAGKTGTAQAFRDAWFVGYTPRLSAAVWMGDRDGATSLVNVNGLEAVTGGSLPAETWGRFMSGALEGKAEGRLGPPPAEAPPTTAGAGTSPGPGRAGPPTTPAARPAATVPTVPPPPAAPLTTTRTTATTTRTTATTTRTTATTTTTTTTATTTTTTTTAPGLLGGLLGG